jgi:Flp pilus assembly CpaE family ATPase
VLPLDIFGVKLIESLLDIAGRHYGTVVIDLPVALAGWVGPVFEHADQVFLVTQVNVIALRTARALLDALDIEGLGRNHIAVVASRYPASGYGARITLDRAREVLGVPVRGRIPSDYPSIVESLDYGVPAAISAPHSRYTRAVASLLDSLERDESAGKSGRGLFRLWSVRRQNIWLNLRRRLAECGPRLGVDVRRRACGAASADGRWSVA